MNRIVATIVVIVLVFAMAGTIAWNEYVQGRWDAGEPGSKGAWELGSVGAREPKTSTPDHFLPTNTSTTRPSPSTPAPALPIAPFPTPPITQAPPHPGSPTPAPPREASPTGGSTHTPVHSDTLTPTVTISLMQVASQFGVNLRDAPAGEVIRGLANGTLVQPYLDSEEEADGLHWLHVVTLDGVEGWLSVNNLIPVSGTPTATP